MARDGELIRRYSAMSRFWGRRGLLTSAGWEPHAPVTVQYGVFASKWPSVDDAGNTTATTTTTLYSVVNRAGKNLSGVQVVLDTAVQQHFYDCYHGVPLTPVAGTAPGGPSSKVTLAFDLVRQLRHYFGPSHTHSPAHTTRHTPRAVIYLAPMLTDC